MVIGSTRQESGEDPTGEGEPFKTDLSDGEKMELLQKIIKKQDIIDVLNLKIQRLEKHLMDMNVMRTTMDQLTDEIINQSPEVPGPSFKPAPLKKKTGKKSVHL